MRVWTILAIATSAVVAFTQPRQDAQVVMAHLDADAGVDTLRQLWGGKKAGDPQPAQALDRLTKRKTGRSIVNGIKSAFGGSGSKSNTHIKPENVVTKGVESGGKGWNRVFQYDKTDVSKVVERSSPHNQEF
ncbi:unnamed protein product, partial [Aphanomyces euteiches]